MKICLDAGHYASYNKSPVNSAYWESDFTWKFHLLLKTELEKYGITVVTTRTDKNKDMGLETRGKKSQGCDLFLSIHSNACDAESVDYPLACCTVTGKADKLGQNLADMIQRVMGTNQNGRILKKVGSGNSDWYGVLRGATSVGTPSILLEHSFHTNRKAVAWLLNDDNLKKMAVEEAKTIAEYYGMAKTETNVSSEETEDVCMCSCSCEECKCKNKEPQNDETFLVKVTCDELNVRSGPGTNYTINQTVKNGEVFTIVFTNGNWGQLKSGAGWINISSAYCNRI